MTSSLRVAVDHDVLQETPARALTPGGLAVLLLGFLPVNFTFGAVNLLVPAIAADLDTGPSGGALVLSAYTTTFAAGLVVSGRLGDRYGRRRLFTIGLTSLRRAGGADRARAGPRRPRGAARRARPGGRPLHAAGALHHPGDRARRAPRPRDHHVHGGLRGRHDRGPGGGGRRRRLAARGPGLARGPADHRRDRARGPPGAPGGPRVPVGRAARSRPAGRGPAGRGPGGPGRAAHDRSDGGLAGLVARAAGRGRRNAHRVRPEPDAAPSVAGCSPWSRRAWCGSRWCGSACS